MSHSVTITRTTTSTTNTSYIVLNTGYLKSFVGLLKLFELLIGVAMVGIFSYYQKNQFNWVGISSHASSVIFAFLIAVTFMIGTFCLLLSCLISLSTGGIISKTIYELIYHTVAAILLLACSINLLIEVGDQYKKHDGYMAASILGLANSVLYFISAFLAHRSYRGI